MGQEGTGGKGCPEELPDSAWLGRGLPGGGSIFDTTERIGRARQALCPSVCDLCAPSCPGPSLAFSPCVKCLLVPGPAFGTDRAVEVRG